MFESFSNRTDWPVKPLSAAIRINKESRFQIDDLVEYRILGVTNRGGGVAIKRTVRGSDLTMREYQRASVNQLMWCKVDTKNGAFGVTTEDHAGCLASPNMCLADIDTNIIDPRLLQKLFMMPTVVDAITAASLGTTNRQYLKPQEVLDTIRLRLPSLIEQKRLVARIEELAAQIQEARTLRHQATQEAEALYSQQLSIVMMPHDEGWKRETVVDVIESMDAGWSPQCDDLPAKEGEWGVLKTTSVQWCNFQAEHNKALPQSLQPIPHLAVKKGDILVTRAGPRKRVAVVAAVRRDEPFLTISDKLIRLRANLQKIEPRFLELSLASPFSQEHLVQRKTGLADAQVNISQTILKATPVAYPSLIEQCRIVAELDRLQAEVERLKSLQSETARELDALLPAILDRAFKGELLEKSKPSGMSTLPFRHPTTT